MNKSKNYHLRELKAWRFREDIIPSDFRRFAEQEVLSRLELTGYKMAEKQELAIQIARNLILSGLGEGVVSDSRNTGATGIRIRVKVWDVFINSGFAVMCAGSEKSGLQTLYQATGKLLELKRLWELGLLMDTNLLRATETPIPSRFSLIYVHTGKMNLATGVPLELEDQKQLIPLRQIIMESAQPGPDGKPDPRAIENGFEYFRGIEDIIEKINHINLTFSWMAFATDPITKRDYAFQPNPCLRQLYVGKDFRYGRLYSWGQISGQNLRKEQRRRMLIDGEQTAELDFSCYQIRMLYHPKFDPPGDLYRPEIIFPKLYGFKNVSAERKAIARDFVKHATNICLNVHSRGAANSAAGRLYHEHPERKILTDIIYKIEGITPTDIIERIQEAHPDVADQFFIAKGAELTKDDGIVMRRILNELVASQNRPALGIHDSLVVRASDVGIAREIMADKYYECFRNEPVIKRVY